MIANDPAWKVFAALQSEPDPRSIHRSVARDEALDAVLAEVLTESALDLERTRKRFDSLRRNRLSKHNNRLALDRRRFRATHRRGGSDFGSVLLMVPERTVFDQVAYNQLAALIRTVLPEEEFRLLLEIADGQSYAEVARDRNMTISGVKSKAFRIREKVRKSRILPVLRHGLRCQSGCESDPTSHIPPHLPAGQL
jgi:DNA-directed RNA polymerase specialized sigma24 family protein